MTANNLKAAMQWPLESCRFYFNLLSHLIMQSIDFNSILFSVRGCQVHYALFTLNHCKRDQAASGSTLIQNIHSLHDYRTPRCHHDHSKALITNSIYVHSTVSEELQLLCNNATSVPWRHQALQLIAPHGIR